MKWSDARTSKPRAGLRVVVVGTDADPLNDKTKIADMATWDGGQWHVESFMMIVDYWTKLP